MIYSKADFYKTTRFKTTILFSVFFLLLEFTSALVFYFYIKDVLIRDIDDSLTKQSQLIFQVLNEKKLTSTDFLPDSVYTPKETYVINLLNRAVMLNPRNTFIQVKYLNDLIYLTDNLKEHYLDLPVIENQGFSLITITDTSLSVHEIRAALLCKNDYQIIVAAPTTLLNKTLAHIIDINIYLTPFFFLLAVIGGAFISSKSLARIDRIINKAREISAYNLSEKIPGADYNDEYGRLVRTLNDMNMRIKTSVDYMNQFTMAVSHELKTPLTILQGEIEIALKSPKTTDQYMEVLKSNYEETLRLKKIIDQLFLMSKLDFSINDFKRENVRLADLFQPLIINLQRFSNRRNKKIEFDIEDKDIIIFTEPNLLNIAITNLVDNAVKYAEEGTTVKVVCKLNDKNKLIISVNNLGRIIPESIHTKIFERFFRSESSREREPGGMGLGLAITKTIVELHGGKIFVESDSEKGTTFNILLDASK